MQPLNQVDRRLKKTNGHRIRQISDQYTGLGLSCLRRDAGTLSEIYVKTDKHYRAEDSLAIDMEWFAIGFIDNLIRQSCHFERDSDGVLLQLVDILNTQFKNREGSCTSADIHHWNVWIIVDEKVVQSLTVWLGKRLHGHLEKWTLKFKLLYLLNYISPPMTGYTQARQKVIPQEKFYMSGIVVN